jgi:5-hydroxyisourate hydrolase-like protein (transthyretin family)
MRKLIPLFLLITALTAHGQTPTLPVPTNLKVEMVPSIVPAVVRLTWDAPAGPWGFKVYRSEKDTTNFKTVAVVNDQIYYDGLHDPQGKYFWTVTSVAMGSNSQMAESGHSNIVSFEFGTAPPPAAHGVIVGHVADDTTGGPIPHVAIRFMRNGPAMSAVAIPTVYTDNDGNYKAVLDTGTYYVRAEPTPFLPPGPPVPPGYRPEWFNNVQEFADATPVVVKNMDSARADFGLSHLAQPPHLKGIISGTVIDDATSNPIPLIAIRFYGRNAATANALPMVITDSLGHYKAELDTGTYLVHAESLPLMNPISKTYRAEWFDNVTEIAQATPVPVTAGGEFVANFGLMQLVPPTPCTITGTVTDTLGVPLRRATVAIMRPITVLTNTPLAMAATPEFQEESMNVDGVGFCRGVVWKGLTDSLGHFSATVRGETKYIALAAKLGFMPEYYKEQNNPAHADVFTATSGGTVNGIDFTLAPTPSVHNSISGSVIDSLGNGIPSRIVLLPGIMSSAIRFGRFGHTDSTGKYTIGELRAGNYYVLALPFHGYAPAFYKAGAFGVLNWQNADLVPVNGDVSGIDIGVVPFHFTGVAHLAGRVTGPGGGGVDGVRVCAMTTSGEVVGFGLSDPNGDYAVEGLPSGAMTLMYDCEGFDVATKNVSIGAGTYTVNNINQNLQTAVTDVAPTTVLPEGFGLDQNYPNPFNPTTAISYQLSAVSKTKLAVYDLLGREMAVLVDGVQPPGNHEVRFDASRFASGTYFYRLEVGGLVKVRKMTLVR